MGLPSLRLLVRCVQPSCTDFFVSSTSRYVFLPVCALYQYFVISVALFPNRLASFQRFLILSSLCLVVWSIPSSSTNFSKPSSSRQVAMNFQDVMSVCRAYAQPYLVIAFKYDPTCPEISRALRSEPVQHPHDGSSIERRVFRMKVGDLFARIKDGSVLGSICAAIRTIEFHKEGSPHAQFLVWLARDSHSSTQLPRLRVPIEETTLQSTPATANGSSTTQVPASRIREESLSIEVIPPAEMETIWQQMPSKWGGPVNMARSGICQTFFPSPTPPYPPIWSLLAGPLVQAKHRPTLVKMKNRREETAEPLKSNCLPGRLGRHS